VIKIGGFRHNGYRFVRPRPPPTRISSIRYGRQDAYGCDAPAHGARLVGGPSPPYDIGQVSSGSAALTR